jgi:hypothetical protein
MRIHTTQIQHNTTQHNTRLKPEPWNDILRRNHMSPQRLPIYEIQYTAVMQLETSWKPQPPTLK